MMTNGVHNKTMPLSLCLSLIIFLFFLGLSESEAKRLENFMHFRESKDLPREKQQKAEWTPAIDFLDVLSEDIPKG